MYPSHTQSLILPCSAPLTFVISFPPSKKKKEGNNLIPHQVQYLLPIYSLAHGQTRSS